MLHARTSAAIAASLLVTGCGGASSVPTAAPLMQAATHGHSGSTPIAHIVVIVQENRTFNNLFATFPGVTGATTGWETIGTGTKGVRKKIKLAKVQLTDKVDLNHAYQSFLTGWDNGAMDDFNNIVFTGSGKKEGSKPYEYVNPKDVKPYWAMASQYAIANAMFQTQGSGSFTAHQDLIRGGTELNAYESLIDDPTSAGVWGCDSPPNAKTSLITTALKYESDAGPFPCTSKFPSSSYYTTLETLLDKADVSWKYYTPPDVKNQPGAHWDAFDVIATVRNGPEWGTNVVWPQTKILTDISGDGLPAVSWVIPDAYDSDHPGYAKDTGPSWVGSVVNAIGESPYWDSTAIIVLWDDWGGFYDPVAPPPRDEQGGPGFRVPLIAISPYTAFNASGGSPYVSNTVYGFGSVVRFIEDTFNLGSLGTTDATSNSIVDMFNFQQKPRSFTPIETKYSRAHYLRQVPSGLPVDTE